MNNHTSVILLLSNGTVDQLASLLNPETVGERLDNGMTLLHLCCMAAVTVKTDSVIDIEGSEAEGTSVLQLMRSSREKSVHEDSNCDHINEQNNMHAQHSKQTQNREVKEQIRLLLKRGADPAIISKNGFSPLHIASYKVKTTPCVAWFPAWSDIILIY